MPSRSSIVPGRRRFLAGLGIGSAALGAIAGSALPAYAQTTPAAARRHAADDWMDQLPTAHRMVFDAVSLPGTDDILAYATNVFTANRTGYDVDSHDVGVIVILRHNATPCAFNDAIWAKYGSVFAREMKMTDPKPVTNPANKDGAALDAISALGARFAVCAMASRRFAGLVAGGTGGTADAILEEFGRNLIRNAQFTPAGIVAVGRAQERGFAFGYAG